MNKKTICALCACLLMTGCGGGGGGSSAPSLIPNETVFNAAGSILSGVSQSKLPGAVTQTADGSISQSSYVGQDIDAVVSGPATGPNYRVEYDANSDGNAEFSLSTGNLSPSLVNRVSVNSIQAIGIGGASGVAVDITDNNPSYTNDGNVFASVFTDYQRTANAGVADTDYTVYGIWAYTPTNPVTSYTMGAFFDTPSEYRFKNINAASGQASYLGHAFGAYMEVTSGSSSYTSYGGAFRGNVVLNANFDTNKIGGQLSGVYAYGSDPNDGVSYSGNVRLNEADIMSQDSGANNFFSGVSSGILTRSTISISTSGNWGGLFYGGDGNNEDQPAGAGGTFAGTAVDSTGDGFHYFGTFNTTKQ